ncbi:MAG TPA: RodZ domain-containing protein [Dongiaceae bacterium]|nr:RodZ domain-containing protein [Dongiaceae bacterium]
MDGTTETNRAAGGGLAEIGVLLRRRREEIGRDLAVIAATTHIRQNYLKAIEDGRRKDLPGTAYMIGYIRTYADYLGFDGNRLINDYHAELAGQRKWIDKRAEPAEPASASLPQIQASPVVVMGTVVVLALAAYGAWSIFSRGEGDTDSAVVHTPSEEAAPSEPPVSGQTDAAPEQPAVPPARPSPSNAEASAPAEPAAPARETASATEDQVPPEADVASTGEEVIEESPAQPEAAAEPDAKAGKIVVRARLESWIQITNEKKDVVFSRVLRAGETYTVPEEKGLMLTTGNAGGVEILLNGKKLKSLGTVGLVKRDIPLDAKKLKDGSAFKATKPTAATN